MAVTTGPADPVVCVHLDDDWCGTMADGELLEHLIGVAPHDALWAVDDQGRRRLAAILTSAGAGLAPTLVAVAPGANVFAVVRAAAAARPGRDIAYVRGGAAVPADWAVLLRRAASEDDRIGVVSPLSDFDPVLSPFPAARPPWMNLGHVTRWLAVLSHGHVFDVPAILPFCAYFRAGAVSSLAGNEAVADGLAAIRAAGWSCVCCDWMFAEAPQALDPARRIVAAEDARMLLEHHPLGRLQHAFGEATSRGVEAVPAAVGPVIKPVQLHVTHSWGGGLGRWIEDMCMADDARHNLVLRSIGTWGAFGQRIALYASHEMSVPLREWQLDMPIRSVATGHVQYRALVAEIIRDFRVDVLLVSSVIGHSLDILDSALPTVVAAHDYFPFCPALVIHFDTVCSSCDGARLAQCFAANPLNRFFANTAAHEWMGIRARYLDLMQAGHIRLAAPSASVVRHLRELAPELAGVRATVVPNGIEFPARELPEPAGGRLRLVVLGSLAAHKGASLLESALPALLEIADVHLLGCGEEGMALSRFERVRVTQRYRHDELPALIAAISPHAGLMLSVVPETFSYTLSELWALGVVPVATHIGAFADRIEHGRTGYLIAAEAGALIDAVRHIDADRDLLRAMRQHVLAMPRHSRGEMVAAYHALVPLAPWVGTADRGPARSTVQRSQQAHGSLHVDPQAPLRVVLTDFLDYLSAKARSTPRLGKLNRKLLLAALAQLIRWGRREAR